MKRHILVVFTLFSSNACADPVITFFFKPYPPDSIAQKTLDTFKKPHSIAKQSLEGMTDLNPIAGIFSSYFGFINVSDQVGQTMYPRKESSPRFTIIVTNKITPIIMFQQTVSHWQLVPGNDAAAYLCEQIADPETGLMFWKVSNAPLPADNKIPPTGSIIIIAKPTNVYIPTGITLSSPSPNLVLPPFYAKQGIHKTRNALFMLNFTFLMRPVNTLYQKQKTSYEKLIAE